MTLPLQLDTDELTLPPPGLADAGSLKNALARRRSTRHFLPDPLSVDELSALLWAAFGVNRPDAHRRTAPSAHNWQEIDVYAVMPEGTWRYHADGHKLDLVKTGDLRAFTGTQDFVGIAPLDLVYVADFARMEGAHPDERAFFAGADAGFIAQNVYLYCAGMGLGCVVRGLVNRRDLAAALGLKPTQRIALAQTVGRSPDVTP